MARTATYVYCVVQRRRRPPLADCPPGLPNATRPALHPAGPLLWLVAAEVPLSRYGPEPLEAALRDLRWVSRIALAHERVIEHFTAMGDAVVVPMKLFTIFSTSERATEELRDRQGELRAILERIRGCEEWGIRISRRGSGMRPTRTGPGARRSGAAFLAAKKAARDRVRQGTADAAAAADEALSSLMAVARETIRREPPDGATAPPLVDAVMLVPVARRARLRASVRRASEKCRRAGVDIDVTGPWPAYHFVSSTEPA